MSGKKKKGQMLELDTLVSVDLCQQGANPDAHIRLFKNVDGNPQNSNPNPPANASTNAAEASLFEKFAGFLVNAFKSSANIFPVEEFEKDAMSFDNITARQEVDENLWKYLRAFEESVNSIVRDGDIEAAQKTTKLNETLSQFSNKMQSLFPVLVGVNADNDVQEGVGKSKVEGDDNMDFKFDNIDKSKLTAEEIATFEELAKKSMVAPVEETPANPAPVVTEKAAPVAEETNPEIAKALQELEAMKKSYSDMMEQQAKNHELDVAKKYIPLGKKPEELADTLYNLKKSGEANYNAFVAALDANLELANKSNLFTEVGKNTHGATASGAEAKLAEIAKGFMKDDPNLNYNAAMVKACEANPELRAEYEKM